MIDNLLRTESKREETIHVGLSRKIASAILAAVTAVTAIGTPASAAATTGNLVGRVVDTTGTAVAGAKIWVYEQEGNWDPVATLSTDAAGRFRAPKLKAGSYEIQIGLAGGWGFWAPGSVDDREAAAKYRVVAGRTTRANSTVTAPGRITGKVTTATGEPAAGVDIRVESVEGAFSGWAETATAADGSYAAPLQPGTSYIVKFMDGEVSQYSPGVLTLNEATSYPVESGQTIRVDERLVQGASVTGRLVDAAGAPVAGARVRLDPTTSIDDQWATTGADGRYRFDKLRADTAKVSFVLADGREQWAHQASSWETATEFTLELGTVTTVDEQLLPVPAPVG